MNDHYWTLQMITQSTLYWDWQHSQSLWQYMNHVRETCKPWHCSHCYGYCKCPQEGFGSWRFEGPEYQKKKVWILHPLLEELIIEVERLERSWTRKLSVLIVTKRDTRSWIVGKKGEEKRVKVQGWKKGKRREEGDQEVANIAGEDGVWMAIVSNSDDEEMADDELNDFEISDDDLLIFEESEGSQVSNLTTLLKWILKIPDSPQYTDNTPKDPLDRWNFTNSSNDEQGAKFHQNSTVTWKSILTGQKSELMNSVTTKNIDSCYRFKSSLCVKSLSEELSQCSRVRIKQVNSIKNKLKHKYWLLLVYIQVGKAMCTGLVESCIPWVINEAVLRQW